MKSLFVFNKNQKYSRRFDYFDYFAYRYHRLFFRSLIFRGRKLWAFNFLLNLKYELKIREKIEPFWVFLISLLKITPDLIAFPLKLGGSVQSVPMPITERKQFTFAVSELSSY